MANLSDYIVKFNSVDTLASVTARGSTTSSNITVGNLTSTGIDDNATSTAITIDSDGDVGIGVSPAFTAGGSRKLLQIANSTNGAQIAMSNSSSESENPRIFSDSTNLGFATAATGSGMLQFYTAGTERMRIDSSGNLLMNTSNEVRFWTSDYSIRASTGLEIKTNDFTRFLKGSTEYMRIDSSGRVLINTTTATELLNVANTAGNGAGVEFAGNGNTIGSTSAFYGQGSGSDAYVWNRASSTVLFGTNNTERMRIDSSGNLLVGKTSTTFGASGTIIGAGGYIQITEDGSAPLYLNRLTSHGDQMIVYKDGQGIGSIGSKISDAASGTGELYFSSGNTGLFFDDVNNYIRPCTSTGGARDNIVDLGNSGNRFKNFYMAGDLYVGSSNNLIYQSGTTFNVRAAVANLTFQTNGANERMRIDSSGLVGVNTTNPSTFLEVAHATTGVANNITTYNSNTAASAECAVDWALNRTGSEAKIRAARITAGKEQTWTTTASTVDGYLKFLTVRDESLNEAMRIDSHGDLNLGTSSSWYAQSSNRRTLNVVGGAGGAFLALGTGGSGDFYIESENGGAANIWNRANGNMLFGTNNAERMRIDSSGTLNIGTTAAGGGSGNAGVGFNQNGRMISNCDADWNYEIFGAQGNRIRFFTSAGGGTQVGSITVTTSATAYNTSSDQRLKENIVDAPGGNIDDIRVRSFDWKADGSHQPYGMIAQELVDVAPEAVTKGKTEDDIWSVDYSKLVPMMIKEIQDLKAEVAALKGA